MIKKLLIALCIVCLSTAAIGQIHKCYTDQAHSLYLQQEAKREAIKRSNEVAVRSWIEKNKDLVRNQRGAAVVTIPVVFHVVYKNATQNLADSNIYRQLDILNECFRLQNANFSQTRPIFDTIAADVEIEFCLATVDPNGNPTTGITRTAAGVGAFFDPLLGFDNVKSNATGGKDPWPSTEYFNIWVCDMSLLGLTFVLGYATFPGGNPLKDGIVIQYDFLGFMPNPTTSDKGRTAVHEAGHWLGLRHIWGDGQGSAALCDSSDYVDDTPMADSASQQTCLIKNTCSNESAYWTNAGIDPPDMIENYMDYSYDDCMTMFTYGQKARMLGFLNTVRGSLLTSPGCTPTGIAENIYYDVSVFPNPSSGILNLKTSVPGIYTLVISDVVGRKLKTFTSKDRYSTFDISDLSDGLLLYTIYVDTKLVGSGKVVKRN